MSRQIQPYSDPYLAGIGIGATLLAAYVIVGRGLGASGAFSSVAAALSALVHGTAAAAASAPTAPYLSEGLASPLHDWLVLELIGVAAGGFFSAWLAGRTKVAIEKGPGLQSNQRLAAGLGGGILMGFGAKLARGCTSGQALSGGALFSVGSWIFILTCFAAAYTIAPVARRLWR
jgi:uncharacterized protein